MAARTVSIAQVKRQTDQTLYCHDNFILFKWPLLCAHWHNNRLFVFVRVREVIRIESEDMVMPVMEKKSVSIVLFAAMNAGDCVSDHKPRIIIGIDAEWIGRRKKTHTI